MNKRWIIQVDGTKKILICPYCKKESLYPSDVCENCNRLVDPPGEEPDKKEWW